MLGGCYRHNFPMDTAFSPVKYRPPVLNIFADQDGSFYPDDWRNCVRPGKRWPENSLLGQTEPRPAEAGDECRGATFDDRLGKARTQLLDRDGANPGVIPAFLKGRRRVFILIHGFNNSPAEADAGYDILERSIAFLPPNDQLPLSEGDAVIRFYWDGFVASNDLSPAPLGFWFKAVKTSQRAGQYGLRPILAKLTAGQQAIVITHSRGASVLLSALSDPPYSSRFYEAWKTSYLGSRLDLKPAALSLAPGARIDAIMLGPAVGHLDFCPQGTLGDDLDTTCTKATPFRPLPKNLSMHFTSNSGDTILRKVRAAWSRKFYPTTLGSDGRDLAELQAKLQQAYRGQIHKHVVSVPHAHPFPCYAIDPMLENMLSDVSVEYRAPNVPSVNQRGNCVKHPQP